jgi:UDP-sugar diphosphatase
MDFIVEDFKVEPLKDGKYLKPYFAKFRLNNQERNWELVKAGDSVAILIYNRDNNSFVLVKQFRPALYFNQQNGVSLELCAGLVDKDLSLEQIASEEVIEETGFRVDVSELTKITSFYTSVGFAGSKQHLYFVEVDESQRVSSGGGIDGEEMIEVVEIPIDSAKEIMFDESIPKTPGLLFAFEWYLNKNR